MTGVGVVPRGLPLLALCGVVAAAYFGSAKLGLELAFTTPSVTAIWPPTGIALAALVLGGWRLWPGVALGAFLANVTTDVPVYTAAGITVGNTLEAVAGAYLFKRLGALPSLHRLRDLSALVLVGVFTTPIAATIGVASLELGDSVSGDLASVWRVWWLGDMGGDLLVAPFLFVAATHWPFREAPGRALEAAGLLVALVAVALVAFNSETAVGYVVFPFLIWAALRFWQPGATAAALIVAGIAIAYTADGSGQFMEPSEDDSLLLAQTFSTIAGLTALVLALATSQRTRAERTAQAVAHELQIGLLPPRLAEIPGMETAGWYRAGAYGQEVGGDFYDIFESGTGEWTAVMGDVCGKGPEAAALTALARHTLRAVAKQESEPSAVLRRLNEAILDYGTDWRFITAVCVRVKKQPDGHEVTVSNAGHPPPLIVRSGGSVTELEATGALLGVLPDPELGDLPVQMRAGDALVLFTDGLIEGRQQNGGPDRWLEDALRNVADAPASAMAGHLEQQASSRESAVRDDRAVLVLRSIAEGWALRRRSRQG